MTIADLRCEYAVEPLGIDVTRPRLFWKIASDHPGARQTSYRLTVASNADLLNTPDLWDTGRVESDQTTHVIYEGSPLSSKQRVFWRVTVWDETGGETASDVASWEMGLLDRSDWQAQWIGGALTGGPRTTIPAPFLRRAFSAARPIKRARLYATALGLYECEINGKRVGDAVLSPGWTDYNQRLQYQTYDVTDLLQSGENIWGAVLGDGWYCGHVGWNARQFYGDQPKFLGQLFIDFVDGSQETIVTDSQWHHAFGPLLESDLLMGESFDARLDFPGWSAPGFDAANWQPVTIFDSAPLEPVALCAPLGPPVKIQEEITPNSEPKREGDAYIFDMGQNMVGRVRLKVSGPCGTTVRLKFAESLAGGPAATEGPIYTTNLRSAKQTDYYTLSGEGEEVWEPRFTFHGFRYVEVQGFPGIPSRDAIMGIVIHSDTPKTGDFACSDPLITQLQKNIDWGQRGNFVDIPTDCPQRDERLGWMGDAQVFIRTAAFNRDVAGFFIEWARDVADSQGVSGAIPCTVPDVGVLGPSGSNHETVVDGGPAWSDAVLICPWTIYQVYGDTRILDENYETLRRYVDYLTETSKDHLRCYEGSTYFGGFGDWLALDGSGKTEGGTPKEILGTAFYAHSADLLSRIAKTLGKDEDAARYAALFGEIKTVFVRRYITQDGLTVPPNQTPYLIALEFDLMPQDLRAKAANELVKDIRARGGKLSTGFVGSPYINHILTETGHHDVAFGLLFQTQWPSWLYAVTQGATTIWERWDGWTEEKGFQDAGMNSFNHYAYGAIGAWLYQVVAGIDLDPETPGYKRFVLKPRSGRSPEGKMLTWASARLDTLHGRIESAWRIEADRFHWDYTVPPNTTAFVTPPTGESFEAGPGKHSLQCLIDFDAPASGA